MTAYVNFVLVFNALLCATSNPFSKLLPRLTLPTPERKETI